MIALDLAAGWLFAVLLTFLDGRRRWASAVAALGFGASVVLSAIVLRTVLLQGPLEMQSGAWPLGVSIRFRADALSAVFCLLIWTVLFLTQLQAAFRTVHWRSFPALLGFMGTGLNGLFLTADAFNFYVFFEMSMVAAFALASYGEEGRRIRAAYTFGVVNLLGSVLFLAAVAAIYHVTGTLDMKTFAAIQARGDIDPAVLLVISSVLFVAFGLKLGLFPFHFWLPPVYRDVNPLVAAVLSGALANIGSYGLLRFGGELFSGAVATGRPVLLALGLASALYGATLAISRPLLAEVLGYSSVGQAGYILFALAVGDSAGYTAAVLYAVVNSLNKTLLFLSEDLRGALLGAAFFVGALSVAGIPPSAGFFAKLYLLKIAVDDGSALQVAILVCGSILSIVYMFQSYGRAFWRNNRHYSGTRGAVFVSGLLGGVLLLFGLWPEPLLYASRAAAIALVGGTQ